jgi:hypothetical protein
MSDRKRSLGARLVLVLAIFAVVLTGCKGKDSETKTTTGADASPTATEATSSPVDGAKASPGTGAGKLTTPPPLQTKGEPLPANAVRPTDPGGYTYDETGVRKLGCAPDEAPASPTSLKVDPADGNRQHSVRDQRYPDGHGVVSNSVIEFREEGVYLVHLKQTQTFPFLGTFTTEFEPSPPTLVFPANTKVGQTWTFTLKSKDGKVTVDATYTLESSSENVTLGGGQTIESIRVKGSSHVTGESPLGPMDFTDNTMSWISVQARLFAKTISDVSGTAGTCRFDGTHIEAVLRSTTPS